MTNFNSNQGSLLRSLLVLSAFCVNFGAADSDQVYSAPVAAAPAQVYSAPVAAPLLPPAPVVHSAPLLPPAPVVYAPPPSTVFVPQPVVVPTVTYVTFPTVYVPVVTTSTVVTTVEAPPKLKLFCPRRCFIRLNRFGVEVCRCPERDNNGNSLLGDLALGLALFGGRGGGGTSTPPPPTESNPYD